MRSQVYFVSMLIAQFYISNHISKPQLLFIKLIRAVVTTTILYYYFLVTTLAVSLNCLQLCTQFIIEVEIEAESLYSYIWVVSRKDYNRGKNNFEVKFLYMLIVSILYAKYALKPQLLFIKTCSCYSNYNNFIFVLSVYLCTCKDHLCFVFFVCFVFEIEVEIKSEALYSCSYIQIVCLFQKRVKLRQKKLWSQIYFACMFVCL